MSIDYVKEFCVKGATPKTVLDQVTADRNARAGGGAGAGGGGVALSKNDEIEDEIKGASLRVSTLTRKRLSQIVKEYQWTNPNDGQKVCGKSV